MPDRRTPPDRLLTRQEVAHRLGCHVSTTYTMQGLPLPVRLTRQVVRWDPNDVEHYIQMRKKPT